MALSFHSLELRALAAATEDEGKVKSAILHLLPEDIRGRKDVIFDASIIEGHFGNRITAFVLTFRRHGDIRKILDYLVSKLDKRSRSLILESMEERIDDSNNLYIRFDKQEAYTGVVKLGSRDAIQLKAKVAAFPATKENAVKVCENYFGQ